MTIFKWAQEDVKTLYNPLNNNKDYIQYGSKSYIFKSVSYFLTRLMCPHKPFQLMLLLRFRGNNIINFSVAYSKIS